MSSQSAHAAVIRPEHLRLSTLSWDEDYHQFSYLMDQQTAHTRVLLEDTLTTDERVPPPIADGYQRLDTATKRRLWESPSVAELLTMREDSTPREADALFAQLIDLVAAELERVDPQLGYPRRPLWSSTGDHAIGADGYVPLRLHNGTPVDYDGYFHHLGAPTCHGYSLADARRIVAQLDRALEIITRVCPNAGSLIEVFTRVIQVRANPDRSSYNTWSIDKGIGKIYASNMHRVVDELPVSLDLLIHESLHGFLHAFEYSHSSFLIDGASNQSWIDEKVVSSPWTGNSIDLASYTHAVCVWYGIHQFWLRARDNYDRVRELISLAEVEAALTEAARGFTNNNDVLAPAGDKRRFVTSDHAEVMRLLQEHVRWVQARYTEI